MNIADLKTKQSLCEEQSKQLDSIIESKQKWVDYFSSKQEKSLRNAKTFLLNFISNLIIALTCFLTGNLFLSSCFAGLSLGCLIVSGYQKFVVYRKFKKVVKAVQKNIDICKLNKEKLEELSYEIEAQIKVLQNMSESTADTLRIPNQPLAQKSPSTLDTNIHTL